jgi:hypothetical protein
MSASGPTPLAARRSTRGKPAKPAREGVEGAAPDAPTPLQPPPDLSPAYVERTAPLPSPAELKGLRRPLLSCVVPPPPFRHLQAKVRELIAMQGTHPDSDLIEETIMTCLKLVRDAAPRHEIRVMHAAVKELRYAFKIYRGHMDRRKVTVFGSARTPPEAPAYRQAWRFSREMVKRGYMVITGAGGGIMEAAQGGAGRENSFGMNIRLPFEQEPNKYIRGDRKLIYFRYFFTRKLCFVKEASAIALFPGGFGTYDEAFETLTLVQTGKAAPVPILFIDSPGGRHWKRFNDYVSGQLAAKRMINPDDVHLYRITDDPVWAADQVVQFYKRYHSSRYVNGRLVLRLNSALPSGAAAELARRFQDILEPGGAIKESGALPEEEDQPELARLPRLVLPYDRRHFGRLRQLIDAINQV